MGSKTEPEDSMLRNKTDTERTALCIHPHTLKLRQVHLCAEECETEIGT